MINMGKKPDNYKMKLEDCLSIVLVISFIDEGNTA